MRKNTVTGFLLLALGLGAGFSAVAQTPEQKAEISRKYNHEEIAKFREELKQKTKANHDKTMDLAKINGWPLRIEENGRVAFLYSVTEDNQPIYRGTDNAGAAITARVPAVRTGGSLGLDLNGQDMTIGIWEIGNVRTSHVDLSGRVVVKDNANFNGHNEESMHATHVAGTMIGSGTGNANAKGLAYQGDLWAYNADNDINEALDAAEDGLLVSNHSYGIYLTDATQGMRGQYNIDAYDWDDVMFLAPFYQAVHSAGNSNGAPDFSTPTYDLLIGDKNSKNAIIVAAVNEVSNFPVAPTNVGISSFTSYGPSGDRRIKPDIATKGVGVFSCNSTTNLSYETLQGTSMASPGVAACLALMQQHYHNTFDVWMRAATVRALMINTADEIGPNDGPDARTGWGLINTEKAVQLITEADNHDAIIKELTLANGGTYTLNIMVPGNETLKATIAWTDRPGNPNTGKTTPKLVNDLDIKVTKNGEDFLPWRLHTLNDSAAAIKGENNVDNVEQVEIKTPGAGIYTIEVTHDGALTGGQQAFSLIVNGGTDNLAVAENALEGIRIYPNPADNIVNINLGSLTNGDKGTMVMYDIQGRLVKQFNTLVDKIDVSVLSPGMYILNIEYNGFKQSEKIIVE